MASSDSQIGKPQHGHPKRAEVPDVNINTGAQSINTSRDGVWARMCVSHGRHPRPAVKQTEPSNKAPINDILHKDLGIYQYCSFFVGSVRCTTGSECRQTSVLHARDPLFQRVPSWSGFVRVFSVTFRNLHSSPSTCIRECTAWPLNSNNHISVTWK